MKGFLFFLLSIITIGRSFAQTPYNPSLPLILPQTPNSATLEKFGNYEVSMFTGIPDISIPLYTIKTAGFEVPITLAYHASGNKVTDFPSWVGLNWAIDAGGQINRTMVGLPDEGNGGFLHGETRSAASINNNSDADVAYLENMNIYGVKDSGADLFSYSFPGGGGKFYFGKIDNTHYKPVLMPYSPVNISYNNAPVSNLNFNLADVHGNKYQFGQNVQEFSSTNSTDQSTSITTTAWMLEKMVSTVKRDTINFSYQSQTDVEPTERVDTWVVDHLINYGTSAGPYTSNPVPPNSQVCLPGVSGPIMSYVNSTMFSQQPQQINFKNGKVVFQLDNAARLDFNQTGNSKALKYIQVFKSTPAGDVLLKQITFFYSYFTNGASASTQRLRLDSIQVSDGTSTRINSYKFSYNTSVNLPAWSSFSKDYWGYYNNQSNTSTTPQQSVSYWRYPYNTSDHASNITIGSTNANGREPDSTYMQAGILTSIVYPTGGHTDFKYEANRYLDTSLNQVKLAGGLRIKSISSYDGVTPSPVVKSYQYGASGYGRKNFFLSRYSFFDTKYIQVWENTSSGPTPLYQVTGSKTEITFYSNPTINIQPLDGSPVVYPFVTEYIGTGSAVLGKTEYRYRDSADFVANVAVAQYTKPVVVSKFYSRGQLLDKKTYKTTALGLYQPVEEETNIYNSSFPYATNFGGLILDQLIVRNGLPFYSYTHTTEPIDWAYNDYNLHSDDNYMTSSTHKTYNADDSTKSVSTTTQLAYTNFIHQQPTQVSHINSRGETETVISKYPADYAPSGSSVTGNAVLDTMIARNVNAEVIEKYSALARPGQSTGVTGGENDTYKLSNGLLLPDKQSRLKVIVPLTDYAAGSVSGGTLHTDSRYDPVISYNLFDGRGNVLEVQRVNGIRDVYIWAYNGAYPVAKVTGTDFNTVNAHVDTGLLNNPAVTQAQINSQLALLRNGLTGNDIMVETYTYNPLVGVTSSTDPKGETTYYEYDSFQRLINIKDKDGNIIKHTDYHYNGQ